MLATPATPEGMTRAELAKKMMCFVRYEPAFYNMADAVNAKTKEEQDRLEAHLANYLERALEDFKP